MNRNSFLRLLKFMKKTWPLYLGALLTIAICNMFLQILLANILKEMFDSIAALDFPRLMSSLTHILKYFLIIFLITPFAYYGIERAIVKTTAYIRTTLFEKIQALPISFFKEGHSGDLISRMTNDINETERAYGRILIGFTVQLFGGIGSAVYMIILDWRLGIFSIIAGLLTVLANVYFADILRKIGEKVQARLGNLTEKLSDLLAGIHVVRSFNVAKIILGKYFAGNAEVYGVSFQRVKVGANQTVVNGFLRALSILGLVSFGAFLSLKGLITVGIVVGIVQLQNGVTELFRTLGTFVTNVQGSLAAADRIHEIYDTPSEPKTFAMEESVQDARQEVIFNNVKFAYDGSEMVLNGLNFKVAKGQVVALVGPSGGGKSTVLKLILGFYQPQGGDIQIEGQSIAQQTLEEIRERMAYVPQDAFLFAGTVMENIRMGRESATDEEVIQAAKMANAHDFIVEFEKGYETLVGERGTHLSGGQRQRIAIARAILKDAPILLLDEATSSLDSESEHLVQEALEKLMVGRTTIVIAHRLSTIQHAHKIVVIKDGQLVEEGTHEKLLQIEDGIYQKLYTQQFSKSLEEVAV